MKKKRFPLLIFILTVLLLIVLIAINSSDDNSETSLDFSSFCCAKFEYRSNTGIQSKVVTSEIGNLRFFFQSIELEKTDASFDGNWIFRITFNWEQLHRGGPELIVLVNESYIQIEGQTYTVIGDFSQVLENLQGLFNYLLP